MVDIRTDAFVKQGLFVQARMDNLEESPVVDIVTRHTTFKSDEPEEFGGTNHGPMPLELLLGAYLSSVGMLSRVAAKEMDFELKGIDLQARAQIDPREIYGLADVDQVVESVTLEVTMTAQGKADMPPELPGTVLKRCPIHGLLKASGVKLSDHWEVEQAIEI